MVMEYQDQKAKLFRSIESLNAEAEQTARDADNHVSKPSLAARLAMPHRNVLSLSKVLVGPENTGAEQLNNLPENSLRAENTVPTQHNNVSDDENIDFDRKLSRLIADLGDVPPAETETQDRPDALRQTPYLDDDSGDISTKIDALLAPYLKKDTQSEQQRGHPQPADDKNLQLGTLSADQLALWLSDAEKAEIKQFFIAQIKQQLIRWTEQNIDKIVQDALLSDRPKARNADIGSRD